MTALYRLAASPDGATSIISDRTPGPVPGVGDLAGWTWADGSEWGPWEDTLRECRRRNRGRSRDPIGDDGE